MQVKIQKVHERVRPWESKQGGKMKSYRIDLVNQDGSELQHQSKGKNVELAQRETTPAPTVGQVMELEQIERRTFKGNDGEEKVDWKAKKATAGGRGGGGGRAWKPRPDDVPEVFAMRQASIQRQHSQDMAVRVLELSASSSRSVEDLMAELGVLVSVEVTRDDDKTETVDLGLVDAFARDASASGRKAWAHEEEKGEIKDALAKLG